jgi:hypothetical protein
VQPPPPAERPNRRATDRVPGDTPENRRRRLIRHISADPVLVRWLADSKARTLDGIADNLKRRGKTEAAAELWRAASALRTGELSPFT